MGFIQEFNELLGINGTEADMSVMFMVSKGAIVVGYKKLLEISNCHIVVMGKNKRKIKLEGVGLQITSLSPAEVVVNGKVLKVEELSD